VKRSPRAPKAEHDKALVLVALGPPGYERDTLKAVGQKQDGFDLISCEALFQSVDPDSPDGKIIAQCQQFGQKVPSDLAFNLVHTTMLKVWKSAAARVPKGQLVPRRLFVLIGVDEGDREFWQLFQMNLIQKCAKPDLLKLNQSTPNLRFLALKDRINELNGVKTTTKYEEDSEDNYEDEYNDDFSAGESPKAANYNPAPAKPAESEYSDTNFEKEPPTEQDYSEAEFSAAEKEVLPVAKEQEPPSSSIPQERPEEPAELVGEPELGDFTDFSSANGQDHSSAPQYGNYGAKKKTSVDASASAAVADAAVAGAAAATAVADQTAKSESDDDYGDDSFD